MIYTVEKKELYSELQRLVYSQIIDLLEVYRKLGQRDSLGEELENVELRHEEMRNLLDLLAKQMTGTRQKGSKTHKR